LTQQVSSPPEQPERHISEPLPAKELQASHIGIVALLVIIGLLLLLFTGLLIPNLPQAIGPQSQKGASNQTAPQVLNGHPPSSLAPSNAATPLQIPVGHYVIYEQQKHIYLAPTSGGPVQAIHTPGYIYNRAVPPLLTPSGQLLYSGDGLWLTDLFGGTPQQLATIPHNQVVTSMALSQDGTTVAWSTEPANGTGDINLYAGPLTSSTLVYHQSAEDCPCFRVFSFLNDPGKKADTTLLLTDDRGDHHAVQYGLWAFDLMSVPLGDPQLLLPGESQQGPLAVVPGGNTLLYSNYEGVVPAPTDGSVPDDADIDALSYANSLYLTNINDEPLSLGKSHMLLQEQRVLSNSAQYHWVTTPQFSPDGHTLAYIVFSSDAQDPFDRHSSLYTVQISGSGARLQAGKPHVLATSPSLFVELGAWLNDHILTFYADGSLYAVDTHNGAVASIVHTGAYAHIVAVVGQGLA
jgi:hypothetical protein